MATVPPPLTEVDVDVRSLVPDPRPLPSPLLIRDDDPFWAELGAERQAMEPVFPVEWLEAPATSPSPHANGARR